MELFNPALIGQLHAPPANGVRMSMAARLAQILGTAIAVLVGVSVTTTVSVGTAS